MFAFSLHVCIDNCRGFGFGVKLVSNDCEGRAKTAYKINKINIHHKSCPICIKLIYILCVFMNTKGNMPKTTPIHIWTWMNTNICLVFIFLKCWLSENIPLSIPKHESNINRY